MSTNGDVVLGEMQLRAMLDSQPDSVGLAGAVEAALGTAWDVALEALHGRRRRRSYLAHPASGLTTPNTSRWLPPPDESGADS